MDRDREQYDVAIVGASMAGSVAALLYGRRGLKVALIERHSDPVAFKRVCTHLIQPSATPMLRRHGLDQVIEEAGGVTYHLNAWTRWGWIRQADAVGGPQEMGYNVRRETIDPIFRRLAGQTPGVDLMLGHTAEGLIKQAGRVAGVRLRHDSGGHSEVRARLVVAADGRNSQVAEMAGVGALTMPNNRVAYGRYYRRMPEGVNQEARIWFLEPDIAYAFPTDDGQTILATMFPREKLGLLKGAIHDDFPSIFKHVPDFPSFEGAEPVDNVIGMLSMPNQWRRRPPKGLAFVGDAAFSADPLFGVGCGWALQGAEWLVEATAGALSSGRGIDRAASTFRSRLRRRILGHFLITSDYARARLFNPAEKILFSGAARDPKVAGPFMKLGTRSAPAIGFFSPRLMNRAILANLKHRRKHPAAPPPPQGLGTGGKCELVVNGIRTPLLQAGPPTSEEAVVFVHGNPGASDDWFELLSQAGEFTRAVALDLPGFGEADKPAGFDYTVEGYAAHLQAALEQLGIRRAHLVLHDFGGPFGLAWAAAHPQAVASLTLVNTGALRNYRWHYLARIWRTPVVGELFQAGATRPAFRLLLKHGNPKGLPKHFVNRMYDHFDRGTRRAVLKLYRATPPNYLDHLADALRELDPPALVVWGVHDPYIPVEQAHRQTEVFPQARVELLAGSGHWPFADDPQATARLVISFLREQTAAKAAAGETAG